jgi:hypothetical protein
MRNIGTHTGRMPMRTRSGHTQTQVYFLRSELSFKRNLSHFKKPIPVEYCDSQRSKCVYLATQFALIFRINLTDRVKETGDELVLGDIIR